MSVEKAYVQGTRVWIPSAEKGWETAVIVEGFSVNSSRLEVETEETGERKLVHVGTKALLPPLCHPRDGQLDRRDNLTALSVVHEASICNALRGRFEDGCLYSNTGVVTLAFNPCAELPPCTCDEILQYHERGDLLEPHIFSVAEKAYRNLWRENKDQSIIFSGMTGSGKTENTRLTILYLTSTDAKAAPIKEKTLAALTVVQAFGHARTVKNENSSRLGKFIELQYDNSYNLVGAILKTFLLNRSRVVFQPTQEQSFHIFYQLIAVQARFPTLQLNERELVYLNSGNPPETDDAKNSEEFDKTSSALSILGFSLKQQEEIWLILSAILHLGNISFKGLRGPEASDNVECCLITNLHGLNSLVKLFSLDQKAAQPLRKWLCHKRVCAMQDEILQPMTVDLATKHRDCLARFLYKKLFSWLVAQINLSFRPPDSEHRFVGLLDMYGFENLRSNSFEQFCINYANEKIQQYCIHVIFKLEQLEYHEEDIGWSFNEFRDNEPCLELIEGNGGMVEILDEETKKYVQTTKDIHLSWVQQLQCRFENSKDFSVRQDGSANFTIRHFISSVQYDPRSFVEKNRDTAIKELVEVLKDSKNDVLHKIMLDEFTRAANAKEKRKIVVNRSKPLTKSILYGFRYTLATLVESLNKTTSNFVMCIKPNEDKKAWHFDPVCVLEQLHAFNVTEIIKISMVGFFKQQSYVSFYERYHCLLPFEKYERAIEDAEDNCLKIVKIYGKNNDSSHIKFGKTKIFLREGDILRLEELRRKRQNTAAIIIQRAFKSYLEMKHYWQLRRATMWVQNHARKRMKCRRDKALREFRAAAKIQAHVRGYLTRRWYRKFIASYSIFKLYASVTVAAIVKRDLQMQIMNLFASLIQSVYKGWVARRRYIRLRRATIVIQTWVRRHLARKYVRKLREEHIKQTNLAYKLNDLHLKINCLIEKHLTPEELEEMCQISDDTQSLQAKNKALNRVLFEKIETLKVLRGKPPNTHQEIQVNEVSEEITEAVQEAPHQNEEEIFALPKIVLTKDDSSEEVLHSEVCAAAEGTCSTDEIGIPITPEKRTKESCVSTEITDIRDQSNTEDTEDAAQFDVIKAQEASALACQLTPPQTCEKIRTKICPLPELDDSFEEDEVCEHVLHYTTISATEIFKSTMLQDNSDYNYVKMIEAYDKFDIRSEALRNTLKLGDYELMKEKMMKRNSEIDMHKLKKASPRKVKSCTDMALDITYQKPQNPEASLSEISEKSTKEYLGMIQFNIKVTSALVYHIVIDLEVPTILKSDAVMPAIILFMCIRYLDSVNNNHAVVLIMHVYKRAVEGLINNFRSLDTTVLWLANTHQLLNFLKQYSKVGSFGWEQHHLQNTESQSGFHLCNLDVHLLYSPLHLIGEWLFKKALNLAQMRIAELVVPGLLENEEIIDDVTFSSMNLEQTHRMYFINNLYRLLKELTCIHTTCVKCGVSRSVIIQIFHRIFEYINTLALNNFLIRKEMCTNMKATLIRCNIRTIEQWASNRKLSKAIESLAPFIEAMRLLHLLPFSSTAIDDIVGHFKRLNCSQILQIVSAYNPPMELATFDQETIVQTLQAKILEEAALDEAAVLNNSDSITLTLPFEYSPIHFDDIVIPKEFVFDNMIELI